MKRVKYHIETVQFLLGRLQNLKPPKITRKQICELIKREKRLESDYTVASAIRELVRHGVLIRMRFRYECIYLVQKPEIKKLNMKLKTMRKSLKSMAKIKENFGKYNVITRKEINALLPNYPVIIIDQLIMSLQNQGFFAKFQKKRSRGKYMVRQKSNRKKFVTDPIQATISLFGKRVIFCYGTALDLQGLSRYGMSFIVYVHGQIPQDIRALGDVKLKPVKICAPETGKMAMKRKGAIIYLTDIERTIIDCIHHPKYAIGWENILYAFNKIDQLNDEVILKYLKDIRIPSLFAKLGVILEHFQEKWGISRNVLNTMRVFCPHSPGRFFRNEPGKLNKFWNIYVPEWLFENI